MRRRNRGRATSFITRWVMASSRVGSAPATAERLALAVVPNVRGFGERQVQLICRLGPYGPDDAVLHARDCEEFDRRDRSPRDAGMRGGLFGAEPWTESMRAEMEGKLGINAVDLSASRSDQVPASPKSWKPRGQPRSGRITLYPEMVKKCRDGRASAPTASRRTRADVADQGSDAVIRYRTRDLSRLMPRVGDGHATHGQGRRTRRRHADRARREPLSGQVEQSCRDPALAGAV